MNMNRFERKSTVNVTYAKYMYDKYELTINSVMIMNHNMTTTATTTTTTRRESTPTSTYQMKTLIQTTIKVQ